MQIVECKRKEVEHWLLNVHYARRLPSVSYGFRLFVDGADCGALTVGKPASPWIGRGVCGGKFEDRVYELNRLVIADGMPANTASSFMAGSFALLSKRGDFVIVSYADEGWGHKGYIYQATNFIYTGASKPRTDVDPGLGKHSRHYEFTEQARARRKFRSSKHRYVIFIGPNRKKMRRELAYPILPYPKGDSFRYDIKNPIPPEDSRPGAAGES
jgi:hypothetical protein